jgi:hypothetical protein
VVAGGSWKAFILTRAMCNQLFNSNSKSYIEYTAKVAKNTIEEHQRSIYEAP